MNTAVKITFEKTGTIREYSTIEEASENTGLSIASIKMRCNKFREGSSNKKDKIHCMWLDDHTFRHYSAKINKKRKKLVFFRKKLYFCEHIDLFLTIYRIMT